MVDMQGQNLAALSWRIACHKHRLIPGHRIASPGVATYY